MSTPSPELAPILVRLTWKIEDIENAHDAIQQETCGPDLTTRQGARGLTDADCDEADAWEGCLEDLIGWIADRDEDGHLSPDDLRDYARRRGTNMGVGAWRRQTGPRTEYRDLSWITPKLVKLERSGEAAVFLAKLWKNYPTVEAGLREAGVLAEQGQNGGSSMAADRSDSAISKEAKALAVLADHPEYSKKQIAALAGCHVKSLNRFPKFKQAWAILRQGRQAVPMGAKNGETGTVEAWDNDDPDNENR